MNVFPQPFVQIILEIKNELEITLSIKRISKNTCLDLVFLNPLLPTGEGFFCLQTSLFKYNVVVSSQLLKRIASQQRSVKNEFFTLGKTGTEISGYYHMSFLQGNPKCLPAGRDLSQLLGEKIRTLSRLLKHNGSAICRISRWKK